MTKIPENIKATLEEYAEQAELEIDFLKESLLDIYKAIRQKAPDVPKEDVWPVVLDKLYAQEVRDILLSKAEIYIQMFVGASGLRDRNRFRKSEALKQKRKDFDNAVDAGWINEDGTPITGAGKVLRPWWSRQILTFSVKREELIADPENPKFKFFLGNLGGRQAQVFGKEKPKKGRDPRLRPKLGGWYKVRWTEVKDEHPVQVQTEDGENVVFRALGRSAKVTNFGSVEDFQVNMQGIEGIRAIANNFPAELVIPIEKEGMDQWAAEYIMVDQDENGRPIKDWNAFGMVIGRLMQINQSESFGSIALKSLETNDEIRIGLDGYTLGQAIKGVGIGSTIAAWIQPYLMDENKPEERWEANGLGLVALRVIPPMDIDEPESEEGEDDDEDIIEDDTDIEEVA